MKKLYRSSTDKKLTGICGGIAEMSGVDATLLRVLLVVITVFSSGTLLVVYLIAAFIIPKEPPLYNSPTFGANTQGGPEWGAWQSGNQTKYAGYAPPQQSPGIDAMMNDMEKEALRKELEQYRAKVAKYEKGDL